MVNIGFDHLPHIGQDKLHILNHPDQLSLGKILMPSVPEALGTTPDLLGLVGRACVEYVISTDRPGLVIVGLVLNG